jgi:hypothetical protein
MDVYKWQDIPTEQVSPTQSRKVIHTEKATVVRLVTGKDTVIPLHNHVHEQVTMVESGLMRFEMRGESATLVPERFCEYRRIFLIKHGRSRTRLRSNSSCPRGKIGNRRRILLPKRSEPDKAEKVP